MRRQQGFSLIELMIAAVITMVATLLMFQTITIGESAKRTSSSGNDAMRSGVLALDQVSYLARTAGAGMTQVPGSFGCLLTAYANYGTKVLPSASSLPAPFSAISTAALRMAPVAVLDGGANSPDVLMVMNGSSSAANIAIPRGTPQVGGDQIAATNTVGLKQNDVLLLTQYKIDGSGQSIPGNCFLTQVNAAAADVDANQYITANPVRVSSNQFSAPTGVLPAGTNYTLATLGNAPSFQLIGVLSSGGRSDLVSYDLLRSIGPTVIAENVVDFQVLYGVDTTVTAGRNVMSDFDYFGDGIVDAWVAPTGDWSWTRMQSSVAGGTPSWTGAERDRRVKALRVAIVTVDSMVQRDSIARTSNTVSMFQAAGAALQIDRALASSGTFDNHARYQVFESVVPVRNLSGGLSPVAEGLMF